VAERRALVRRSERIPVTLMLRILDRGLAGLSWIGALLLVVLLLAGPSLIGAKKSGAVTSGGSAGQSSGAGQAAGSGGKSTGTTGTTSGTSAGAAGAAVFASAGCAGCHTLKAAGASGNVGPNLDDLQPSADAVSGIVKSGGGAMPSFSGKLSDAQTSAVASYFSTVAGH
jgi:mono/diheme cytochrome c family protein